MDLAQIRTQPASADANATAKILDMQLDESKLGEWLKEIKPTPSRATGPQIGFQKTASKAVETLIGIEDCSKIFDLFRRWC